MKRGTRLLLSAVSGVAAMAIAMTYAASVRSEAERMQQEVLASYGGELVSVCVASREIAPGEVLDERNIEMEQWVSSLLPKDAALSMKEVAGKTATSRIPERAVLCPAYLKKQKEGMSIPKGRAAVSVAVDEEHSLGGELGRGDVVDVYVSRDGIADRLLRATVVDTSAADAEGGEMDWATLAVDQSAVPELLAASSAGPLTLVVPAADADLEGGE